MPQGDVVSSPYIVGTNKSLARCRRVVRSAAIGMFLLGGWIAGCRDGEETKRKEAPLKEIATIEVDQPIENETVRGLRLDVRGRLPRASESDEIRIVVVGSDPSKSQTDTPTLGPHGEFQSVFTVDTGRLQITVNVMRNGRLNNTLHRNVTFELVPPKVLEIEDLPPDVALIIAQELPHTLLLGIRSDPGATLIVADKAKGKTLGRWMLESESRTVELELDEGEHQIEFRAENHRSQAKRTLRKIRVTQKSRAGVDWLLELGETRLKAEDRFGALNVVKALSPRFAADFAFTSRQQWRRHWLAARVSPGGGPDGVGIDGPCEALIRLIAERRHAPSRRELKQFIELVKTRIQTKDRLKKIVEPCRVRRAPRRCKKILKIVKTFKAVKISETKATSETPVPIEPPETPPVAVAQPPSTPNQQGLEQPETSASQAVAIAIPPRPEPPDFPPDPLPQPPQVDPTVQQLKALEVACKAKKYKRATTIHDQIKLTKIDVKTAPLALCAARGHMQNRSCDQVISILTRAQPHLRRNSAGDSLLMMANCHRLGGDLAKAEKRYATLVAQIAQGAFRLGAGRAKKLADELGQAFPEPAPLLRIVGPCRQLKTKSAACRPFVDVISPFKGTIAIAFGADGCHGEITKASGRFAPRKLVATSGSARIEEEVPLGEYRVIIKCPGTDLKDDVHNKVEVQANTSTPINHRKEREGTFFISVLPRNADLYIDGKKQARRRGQFEFHPSDYVGSAKFEIKGESLVRQTGTIRLNEVKAKRAQIKMYAHARNANIPFSRGLSAIRAKKWDAAAKAFADAIKIDRGFCRAHAYRGYALLASTGPDDQKAHAALKACRDKKNDSVGMLLARYLKAVAKLQDSIQGGKAKRIDLALADLGRVRRDIRYLGSVLPTNLKKEPIKMKSESRYWRALGLYHHYATAKAEGVTGEKLQALKAKAYKDWAKMKASKVVVSSAFRVTREQPYAETRKRILRELRGEE